MKSIFITGTAGSGKSLLASKLGEYHTRSGVFPAFLNLDPGVESLPYSPDVDIRDHVDIVSMMKKYDLGPNGALVMASDLIAAKLDDIKREIDGVNPDYLIVDTPGQIELFAYRASGPFCVHNIGDEEKVGIFLYDGALVNTATNFVSIALLSTSIRLRLGIPSVNVLTKTDLMGDRLGDVMGWSTDMHALGSAVSAESSGEMYGLISEILHGLDLGSFEQGLIPFSNVTGEGTENFMGALSRMINLGEEMED